MPGANKWMRIIRDCYAESLPVVQLWNIRWANGVQVGGYDPVRLEYVVYDGVTQRRIAVQPTHWRALCNPPYGHVSERKRWAIHVAGLRDAAAAKFEAVEAARARGTTWQAIARIHGYANGHNAQTIHRRRRAYLARDLEPQPQT